MRKLLLTVHLYILCHWQPVCDITTMSASVGQIKSAVWSKFTETESF